MSEVIALCEHGRRASLHTTDWFAEPFAAWMETRKWYGLRRCCRGPASRTYGDKEEKYYAERYAIKLWNRWRGIDSPPKTVTEAIFDWLEQPE